MNVWFYIIVMAVIQGIAEFLPISSSGHLALLGALFGFDGEKSQALGIVLHAGSLLAIVIFYWKTLLGFLKPEQWRLAAMLILGTIPAGVLGMALELSGFAKDLFDNLMVIGFAFLITATLLRLSEKPKLIIRPSGQEDAEPTPLDKISVRQALAIGIGQMFAILPGLSRSGTTIAAGLMRGFDRTFAVRYSFLLSLPAVLGANILSLKDAVQEGVDWGMLPIYLVGMVVSAVVGYFAIRLVNLLTDKGKFGNFAYYCWGVGALTLMLSILL